MNAGYGRSGYVVGGDTVALPWWAVLQGNGEAFWMWDGAPGSSRGLQRANGAGRVAGTWYGSVLGLDVNFTDGNTHKLSFYAVDWDSNSRVERIDILDATTGAVLDSRWVSGFNGGQYLAWNIRCHVRVSVVHAGGANAVISGVFID